MFRPGFLLLLSIYILAVAPGRIDASPFAEHLPAQRITALIEEAQLAKNTDVHEALDLIEMASDLADQSGVDSLITKTTYYHSLYLFMLGKNEQSIKMILNILPYYRSLENEQKKVGILLNRLGKIYDRIGNDKKALVSLKEAKRIFEKLGANSSLAISYIYLVDVNVAMGSYAEALNNCQTALDLIRDLDDPDKLTMVYSSMGDVHRSIKDFDQAKELFLTSLENRNEVLNQQFLIPPLKNLGIIYMEEHNYREARKYFLESLHLVHKLGNAPDKSEIYYYLAKISHLEGRSLQAQKYIKLTREASRYGKLTRVERRSDLLYAQLQGEDLDFDEAIKWASGAYEWAMKTKDYELISSSAGLLADCYAELCDFEKAYEFNTSKDIAYGKFVNDQKIREVTGIELRYQFDQQRKQDQLAADSKLGQQKQLRNLLIFGLVAMLLTLGALVQSNLMRRRANSSLQEKNSRLLETEGKLEEKNEELREYIESNVRLEQFAHIASHDLRSPLRTVSSFLGLLKREIGKTVAPKQEEYLSYIEKSTKRMAELVDDLLAFAKINTSDVEMSKFSVRHLVAEVLENLDFSIRSNEALIETQNLPEHPILADRVKLRQVFQNLVANAIKFVPPDRKPRITIKCDMSDAQHFVFSVSDNGIGIDQEYQHAIFETFSQLQNKDISEGTGLGLSICKKIVENHQGHIWLESETGVGSTFYFSLPKANAFRMTA